MTRQEIGTMWNRDTRNSLNANYIELYDIQNRAITEATAAVIKDSKLIWQEPVDVYEDLTTTYPNAVTGYTVMARQSSADYPVDANDKRAAGTIWRFNEGVWNAIQDIDPVAFNELDNRLTLDLEKKAKKIKKRALVHYNIPNTLNKLYAGDPTTIVFGGNSLTDGSGASWATLDYVSLFEAKIKNKFPMSNPTIINEAVGGSTSTHLKTNWDTLIPPNSPDLIVIAHDTNDVGISETEKELNYKFFIEQAEILGAELLFVTDATASHLPAPYGNDPDPDIELREQVHEKTREIAKEYDIGLIDHAVSWHRWLSDRKLTTDSTLLHYDHIHPNDLGHRLFLSEIMLPFSATTDEARELDRRYGGKNYNLFGKATFRDLEHKLSNVQGWGIFDLNHQLVDFGGLWWFKQYRDKNFKKAELWGTRAVTGDEPYENNYVDDKHIIPLDKDYIEPEFKDAKRVWFALDGSSATPTVFRVLVDGIETMRFDVSSASKQPVEVSFNTSNLKYFTKGTHTVRIERVGDIPASQKVTFHGFLVQYYGENEGEIFSNPGPFDSQQITTTYATYDTAIPSRQKATNIGFVTPFGYANSDSGFVQLLQGQPNVTKIDFYGDTLTVGFKAITSDNYVMIYVDGVLKATENVKGASVSDVTYQYTGLGARKHKLEVVALNAQVNINRVRFSDTLV